MRFSPLPRGTITFLIVVITLLLSWVVWGTLKHPGALWAPGDLSRFHADVSTCGDCHQPFQGVTADKCVSCHNEKRFTARSRSKVSEFHQKIIQKGKLCTACHTEHRGALAQITIGAMVNPHGEFVFRATGTSSCAACHDFSTDFEPRSHLLDNAIVRHLMEEGEGAHRPGKMAHCLTCHTGGSLEIKENDEDKDEDG